MSNSLYRRSTWAEEYGAIVKIAIGFGVPGGALVHIYHEQAPWLVWVVLGLGSAAVCFREIIDAVRDRRAGSISLRERLAATFDDVLAIVRLRRRKVDPYYYYANFHLGDDPLQCAIRHGLRSIHPHLVSSSHSLEMAGQILKQHEEITRRLEALSEELAQKLHVEMRNDASLVLERLQNMTRELVSAQLKAILSMTERDPYIKTSLPGMIQQPEKKSKSV